MDFLKKLWNRGLTKKQLYIAAPIALILGTLVANGLVALTRAVLNIA